MNASTYTVKEINPSMEPFQSKQFMVKQCNVTMTFTVKIFYNGSGIYFLDCTSTQLIMLNLQIGITMMYGWSKQKFVSSLNAPRIVSE